MRDARTKFQENPSHCKGVEQVESKWMENDRKLTRIWDSHVNEYER